MVGAGIRDTWLGDSGVRVHDLHTWWGALSYTMRRDRGGVLVHLDDGVRVPTGALRVAFARRCAAAHRHR